MVAGWSYGRTEDHFERRMTNVRARYDGRARATSSHIENLEEIEVKLSAYWCSLLLSRK